MFDDKRIFAKIIFMIVLFGCIIQPVFATTTKNKKIHAHHAKIVSKKPIVKKHGRKKIVTRHNIKHKKTLARKKSKRLHASKTTHAIQPSQVNTSNIGHSFFPTYLLTSMQKNLVNFVRNTIESIHYTTYKLGGTRIEPSRGIYIVDCSSYVDHILKTIYPRSYSSLAVWSGTQKPTTNDFYHYFRNLSDNSQHWNSIDDAEELSPGDILVFRSKNRLGTETGGHVMIVMDKPVRNGNALLLRIADAAPSRHSKDTRMPHASGIGIGSMLLKIDPNTSRPYAYAWSLGSRWESNVNFAMARPVENTLA